MSQRPRYDAVIVGAGPNGLAAAITLAREGRSVLVLEAHSSVGGGARSAELTLPGFIHDVCSAVFPVAFASPFFRSLPLAEYGLKWIQPPIPLAHPLDDGSAVVLYRSLGQTAEMLGPDGAAWRRLMQPLTDSWEMLTPELLCPLHFPRHPWQLARFGWHAIRSARAIAEEHFATEPARSLFGGLAAHSILPLERPATASFAMMLGALGHAVGWPIVAGGTQNLSNALARHLQSLGGEIRTGKAVVALDELPSAKTILLDVTPRQFIAMAGRKLTAHSARPLKNFRYGPGVFKVDWAMNGPIPWTAADCARASTVHVGGTFEEIAASESDNAQDRLCKNPFVLVAQPSLFDPTRAPAGRHTAWAYCHVPHGSTVDRTAAIEAQIERFAPGFKDRILARRTCSPRELENYNPNCIGGDITGGANDLRQFFTRPYLQWNPYATPVPHVYLCSASTPPGGGVHGMCGYHAARFALRRELSAPN